jgi:hypothetical protein
MIDLSTSWSGANFNEGHFDFVGWQKYDVMDINFEQLD